MSSLLRHLFRALKVALLATLIPACGGGGGGTSSPGQPTWGLEVLIEADNIGNAEYPKIAVDSSGNATAVWQQDDGIRTNIWSNRYDSTSGTWGTALLIEADDAGSADSAQVAVDANGHALAVWAQSDGTVANILSNRYDRASGMWGTAQLIETDNSGSAYDPHLAVDPAGNATAVWYQSDGLRTNIWSNRYDPASGMWGTAQLIETDDLGNAFSPHVAVDPVGNATAVWHQFDGTRGNIWSNRYDHGTGVWGTAELIETNDVGTALWAKVTVDPSGNATAAWQQLDSFLRDRIWSNRYDQGSGTWGTAELIGPTGTISLNVQLASDLDGNVTAVWQVESPSFMNILSNHYDPGTGSWRGPQLVETDDGDAWLPQLAIAANGQVTAVWYQDGDPTSLYNYDIRANQYSPQAGSWDTSAVVDNGAQNALNPHVVVDPNGVAIAIWQQTDSAPPFKYNIYSSRYQ